jgi:hypothetical protein
MRELTKQVNRAGKQFPRVVVGGTRTFSDARFLYAELDRLTRKLTLPVIVTGAGKPVEKKVKGKKLLCGADYLAEMWASDRKLVLVRFHAQWQKYGAKAGPIRNSEMLEETIAFRKPAFAIFFHDGTSPGTADAIKKAKKLGYVVKVIRYED